MPKPRSRFAKLVDWLPFSVLLPLALILLMVPLKPMPHAWEKLLMLMNGDLTRALDIFDLLFHLLPSLLVAIKIIHRFRR